MDYSDEPRTSNDEGEIIIEEESLKEDYTKIPNTILKRADISPGAKLTYVMLLSYAHKAEHCFPGQKRLAEEMGVAVRSVIRYMQELVKALLLRVKRRGLGKTNLYFLCKWSKPKLAAEPPAAEAEELAVPTQSRSDNSALQQMPNWQREKNKREKNKISNAVITTSLEERGERKDWTPISQLVARKQTQATDPPERSQWLAEEIVAQTGDRHSLDCYRLIARRCPENLLFEALSELKQAGHAGQVKRSPGALLLSIVRRLCSERGVIDPLSYSNNRRPRTGDVLTNSPGTQGIGAGREQGDDVQGKGEGKGGGYQEGGQSAASRPTAPPRDPIAKRLAPAARNRIPRPPASGGW